MSDSRSAGLRNNEDRYFDPDLAYQYYQETMERSRQMANELSRSESQATTAQPPDDEPPWVSAQEFVLAQMRAEHLILQQNSQVALPEFPEEYHQDPPTPEGFHASTQLAEFDIDQVADSYSAMFINAATQAAVTDLGMTMGLSAEQAQEPGVYKQLLAAEVTSKLGISVDDDPVSALHSWIADETKARLASDVASDVQAAVSDISSDYLRLVSSHAGVQAGNLNDHYNSSRATGRELITYRRALSAISGNADTQQFAKRATDEVSQGHFLLQGALKSARDEMDRVAEELRQPGMEQQAAAHAASVLLEGSVMTKDRNTYTTQDEEVSDENSDQPPPGRSRESERSIGRNPDRSAAAER